MSSRRSRRAAETDAMPPLRFDVADRAATATRASGAWSVRFLVRCWIAVCAAGAALALAGALAVGSRAAWGALLGIAIVGAFFTLSFLVIAWVGRRWPSRLMWAALGTYVFKMIALGFVLVLIPRDGAVDVRWMAAGVGLGLAVWLATHLHHVWTTKIFYVDPV